MRNEHKKYLILAWFDYCWFIIRLVVKNYVFKLKCYKLYGG